MVLGPLGTPLQYRQRKSHIKEDFYSRAWARYFRISGADGSCCREKQLSICYWGIRNLTNRMISVVDVQWKINMFHMLSPNMGNFYAVTVITHWGLNKWIDIFTHEFSQRNQCTFSRYIWIRHKHTRAHTTYANISSLGDILYGLVFYYEIRWQSCSSSRTLCSGFFIRTLYNTICIHLPYDNITQDTWNVFLLEVFYRTMQEPASWYFFPFVDLAELFRSIARWA